MIINGQMFKLKSNPDFYGKDATRTPLWILHDRVDIQGNTHVIFCGADQKIQIAPRDPFIAQTSKVDDKEDYSVCEDFRVRFNLPGETLPVVYTTGGII
jgi:hypothetical protein